ncbi:MAG: hypothetical protein ACJAUY_000670 [Cognaticolwellia sp.]|jgi:hypothetical protein
MKQEKIKPLNSAQELLAHIGLKTKALHLFGAMINVKQWTASQRIKYMSMISNTEASIDDELALVAPQCAIVALSMVDDHGLPLFPSRWENGAAVFEDPESVKMLMDNRLEETSKAFVEISKFNGVLFSSTEDEDDPEETAAKN